MKHVIKFHYWVSIAISMASKSAASVDSSSAALRHSLSQRAPEGWPIKNGYVAFGDSFAAGMGTGTTSEDNCRIGSNNFGNLLMRYTDNPEVEYQGRQCSGDTVEGLAKQIDWWAGNGSKRADLATLSIGGNDVWFADFVINCVITINPIESAEEYRKACIDIGLKADAYLDKGIGDQTGLLFKLKTQYNKIMRFAGRDDFHLYVIGYPRFFEAETLDCDQSTFYYWHPAYKPWFFPGVMVTRELRRELNRRVNRMNEVIATAVKVSNEEEGKDRVHFVDVNEQFNHHRWCEDDTHEPDKDRQNTWFFLSHWNDFPADEQSISTTNGDQTKVPQGGINLPNASTCKQELDYKLERDGGVDPYETWMCHIALAVASNPNSEAAQLYKKALDAYDRGEFHSNDITGWFSTTDRIKTFHPRTRGMVAYRDALIKAINKYQDGESDACEPIEPPWGSKSHSGGPDGVQGQGNADSSGNGLQIAVASYISPVASKEHWNRLFNAKKVTVMVANVLNGPDVVINKDWEEVMKRAVAQNIKVLGYVRTGYLGLSETSDAGPFEPFNTRLGSTSIPDWIGQVEYDIDRWHSLYKGLISGIFFDEAHNDCGPKDKPGDNSYAELYRFISENTKRKYKGSMTVLNPGTAAGECFQDSADAIMTFEGNYTWYVNHLGPWINWKPRDPRKIWHIVYDVPDGKQGEVARLAREYNAGLIHITNAVMDNPYDTMPPKEYMDLVEAVVDGGTPLIEDTPHLQQGEQMTSMPSITHADIDYTSVKVQWSYPGPGNPYSFSVSTTDRELVRVPGYLRETTAGNLDPGERLSITVRAIGSDGQESEASAPADVETPPLPGRVVIKIEAKPQKNYTIYEAEILIPAGFVRIYITDAENAPNFPAWPLSFAVEKRGIDGFLTAPYMIEGQTLYEYSGSKERDPLGNYEWKWKIMGKRNDIPLKRDKHLYKWTVPIGMENERVDPHYIVLETEGYGKKTDYFMPCPSTLTTKDFVGPYVWCHGSPGYDCQGKKPECKNTPSLGHMCLEASKRLVDSKTYYANSNRTNSGVCWSGLLMTGCKIYVQGKAPDGEPCKFTGAEMRSAYEDIEREGYCTRCGTRHFSDRCMVSVDFDFGCNDFGAPAIVNDPTSGIYIPPTIGM